MARSTSLSTSSEREDGDDDYEALLHHRDTETQRRLAPLARNRRSPWVPSPRGAMHQPLRSNVRGARGCKGSGVPRILEFLGNCEVFGSNRDPTPLSSPRPVRISSARLLVREHGARGPAALPFVGRKSSRGAKKLRVSSTEYTALFSVNLCASASLWLVEVTGSPSRLPGNSVTSRLRTQHSHHRTTETDGFGWPCQRNRYVLPFRTFMTSAGRKPARHVPLRRRTLG